MFESLKWLPDRMLLGDLVFRLELARDENWELGDECFCLYKDRKLVDQFDRFWSGTEFRPRKMLEIGIWDGGSMAFWMEHLQPERLVAIDLADREDSAYFRRWIVDRALEGRVFTRWCTDQADRAALREVVERDMDGELDLVIDDGSHLAVPTRASFETLFPLLPPGGLYIIEDWQWEHTQEFQDPQSLWANDPGLSDLVCELVAAAGTSGALIRNVSVYEGFVVIERGEQPVDPRTFRIANHIRRRSRRTGADPTAAVKLFAFYLPQFHPIPENDRWWGRGFTEWSRVTRAKPLFDGHYQPHLPERLGYYDLRLKETRAQQAALARTYGIHGFCYYYYWFGGKKLLDQPLQAMLTDGEPSLPFCLCWANENWTRRWDGAKRGLLMMQQYGEDMDLSLIDDLAPYFRDPRYLCIHGAPVLIVYRAHDIPDPVASTQRWRQAAIQHGFPGLHLVAALTFGLEDPIRLGFDAAVEFPPHGEGGHASRMAGDSEFSGTLIDFRDVVRRRLAQPARPFRVYRTAMAGWDNTPRLGARATVLRGASPEAYEDWLRGLVMAARQEDPEHRLVFINAWNEWAEGAHLEPDLRYGTEYLEATLRAQK